VSDLIDSQEMDNPADLHQQYTMIEMVDRVSYCLLVKELEIVEQGQSLVANSSY